MAVLGMLALGVAIGEATDHYAQNAGFPTILLESSAPPEEEAAPEAAGEPEVEEAVEEPAGGAAEPPLPPVEPSSTEPPLPGPSGPKAPKVIEPPTTGPPEIKHVFVIMLGEGGYEETFGETSTSKFLDEELPAQGELLPNYFAVTKGQLANQIALLSGQGPTPETAADCPNYGDVLPGTESAEGQVKGNGCVYPATTETLPGQLAEAGLKWKAYHEEGIDPFAYFHSIIDSAEYAEDDVELPRLATDLKLKAESFPALAYIAPSPLASPETFLKTVVPEIKESLAYKAGGMLVITSAEAPQGGEKPDTSGCCNNPVYPNLPPPPAEAPATGPVRETGGGGRVGALLLSPFVEPGTTSETYFNHYSLLATIEELFGFERLGYGAEPAITGFDESIFNAGS